MSRRAIIKLLKITLFCVFVFGLILITFDHYVYIMKLQSMDDRAPFWKYYGPPPLPTSPETVNPGDLRFCPHPTFITRHLMTEGQGVFNAVDFTVNERPLGTYPLNSVFEGRPDFEMAEGNPDYCQNVQPVPLYWVRQEDEDNAYGVLRGEECWGIHSAQNGHLYFDTERCVVDTTPPRYRLPG